jgi:hypothetical protein
MSRAELLKSSKKEIKGYVETWERITPDEDPLLKRWRQHVNETNKRKCAT